MTHAPLHIDTPILESQPLGTRTGRRVWLKFDALQPTGSFKIRGIGAAACAAHARGATRLVSSSGGNAGLAVAYAGRRLGLPVTVVVPETTTARAKHLIGLEGAEVIVHGASWQEANAYTQALLDASTAFVHPFDDPEVWTGHASVITEVVNAGVAFDAVIVSVGGGGLFAGVIEGLDRHGLSHVPVIAVETHGTDSLAQSVAAGHLVELDAIRSIAITLGAKKVCERAFEATRTHDVRTQVVTDREALDACTAFLDDHRVLVEPSCGASLALVYGEADRLGPAIQAPLVIVCGGATATLEQIHVWRANA